MFKSLSFERNHMIIRSYEFCFSFIGSHIAYHGNIFHNFNLVIIRLLYGKQQFIVFTAIKSRNTWHHIKLFSHLNGFGIERYSIFIQPATHFRLFTQVQYLRSESVGNINHGSRFHAGMSERSNDILTSLRFQLAFKDIIITMQFRLHIRVSHESSLLTFENKQSGISGAEVTADT